MSTPTPPLPPHLATNVSPDEQDRLWEQFKGTPMVNTLVMNGMLPPPAVMNYRLALKAFKTTDPDTLRVKDKATLLAKRDEPVLILGESGTGKELLANIIHGERQGCFVAVNMCAVTDTLFESELFGHVKGAFTGAEKDRVGLIAQAEGGTLFLDEIGDMPLGLQAKLLRTIQHRTFRKVGGNMDEKVKCRFVAATHRDLKNMITSKQFRLDLYERLQVFKLRIKPLRNRVNDIPLYVGKEFADKLDGIQSGSWILSGNVRQLMNLKLQYDTFGIEDIIEEDLV